MLIVAQSTGYKGVRRGFTIVELLIVVVVIAILAAITIVSYNGIQNSTQASAVRADIQMFAKKIELQKVSSSDNLYPMVPASDTVSVNQSLYMVGRNNWYYCTSADRTSFALGVISQKTGAYIYYDGVVTTASSTDDVNTCSRVGKPNGSQMGHHWSGSVGTWRAWLGGNG